MTAASRFERGTSSAPHGQVFTTMWDIWSSQGTKVKKVILLNFYGLRAGGATKFVLSGRGIGDYPADRRHFLSLPQRHVISPHHLLSCHSVLLLDLTILFNSRTTTVTERSNQTYSSQIAERPSLRIVEQGSMMAVVITRHETLGGWGGERVVGKRGEVGVVDEGNSCKLPICHLCPLLWWLRFSSNSVDPALC